QGSVAVKPQALRCLTRIAPADAERAALEALGSKARWQLAVVALQALAGSRSDAALEALVRALVSDDGFLGVAEDVLTNQPHPRATARLGEVLGELSRSEAEPVAAAKVKKVASKGKGKPAQPAPPDPEDVRDQMTRVISVLGARKDPAAVPYLTPLLD